MFNNKYLLPIFLLFLSISILYSCDTVQSNSSGTLQIRYTGIEESDHGSVAAFLLVNDTTETVVFSAYEGGTPHYSAEVLTDTGWTYLMWNWCATGTSPTELKPGSKKKFTTSLPTYDCTWRVILDISVAESEKYYTLKSDVIEFTLQK